MTEWGNPCENSSEAKTLQIVDTVESTPPEASHVSTCLTSEMSTIFIPDYLFKGSLEEMVSPVEQSAGILTFQ